MFIYYTDPANTGSWVEASPSASSIEGAIVTGYINPVYNSLNVIYGIANTSYTQSNLALSVANNALPNTNNAVFDGSLRVTGTLYIGSNTVTISDNNITACSYFGDGSTMQGVTTHSMGTAMFTQANGSMSHANAAFVAANNAVSSALHSMYVDRDGNLIYDITNKANTTNINIKTYAVNILAANINMFTITGDQLTANVL